jgi:hypothetical protein
MLQNINEAYKSTEFKSKIYEVNGLYLPFDDIWNKISIGISGGADSALLAYILCDHISKLQRPVEVHLIHNIRCWKSKPWQKNVVDEVISYFVRTFENISFYTHYNFVPPDLEHANIGKTIKDEYGKMVSGDTIELRSFAEYTCHTNNIPAYYNAITKNPNFKIEGEIDSRNILPNSENTKLMITKHLDSVACHPFRFVDKSWVMSTYKSLGLDELLSLTRSCEGEFPNITYKTYNPKQPVPLCNNCFWCKEREWGLENAK